MKKNQPKNEKKELLLLINLGLFFLSMIISFYTKTIIMFADKYPKTKNLFNGSLYTSDYCKYINKWTNGNLILIFIIIIIVAFIVLSIINFIKKKKVFLKLLIVSFLSIALCFGAYTSIVDCNGMDFTWGNNLTIKEK